MTTTRTSHSIDEWGSFFDTLEANETGYGESESYEAQEKKRVASFRESLASYPLLARIDDFYQDACFSAEEIPRLQNELKRVENLSLDGEARAFLDGMLAGCSAALIKKMGISLLSS